MRGFILGAAGAFLFVDTGAAQTAGEAPIALDTIDVVATGIPEPRRATARSALAPGSACFDWAL